MTLSGYRNNRCGIKESAADDKYVNETGDEMTGDLKMQADVVMRADEHEIKMRRVAVYDSDDFGDPEDKDGDPVWVENGNLIGTFLARGAADADNQTSEDEIGIEVTRSEPYGDNVLWRVLVTPSGLAFVSESGTIKTLTMTDLPAGDASVKLKNLIEVLDGSAADALHTHAATYMAIAATLDDVAEGTTYKRLTAAHYTDLSDGGDTTLHKHDIYLLADGTRDLTGDLDITSEKKLRWNEGEQDEAYIYGDSQTLVLRIGGGQLDELEELILSPANGLRFKTVGDTYTALTPADVGLLTGGGETSLHKHDSMYYTETEADNLLDAKPDITGSPTAGKIAMWSSATGISLALTISFNGWATEFLGAVVVKGGNELRLNDVGNSNYVGFEAPALTADQIWVLPAVDGDAGDKLETDGSGNLTWTGPNIFNANKSSTQSLTTSYADVAAWDAASIEDSNYTWDNTNGILTIDVAGVYEVEYGVMFLLESGTRMHAFAALQVDDGGGYAAVPGSFTAGYGRSIGEGTSCSWCQYITFGADDLLKVQAKEIGGEGVINAATEEGTYLRLKFIRP